MPILWFNLAQELDRTAGSASLTFAWPSRHCLQANGYATGSLGRLSTLPIVLGFTALIGIWSALVDTAGQIHLVYCCPSGGADGSLFRDRRISPEMAHAGLSNETIPCATASFLFAGSTRYAMVRRPFPCEDGISLCPGDLWRSHHGQHCWPGTSLDNFEESRGVGCSNGAASSASRKMA